MLNLFNQINKNNFNSNSNVFLNYKELNYIYLVHFDLKKK